MDVVKGAVRDGDVFLVVTDVYSGIVKEDGGSGNTPNKNSGVGVTAAAAAANTGGGTSDDSGGTTGASNCVAEDPYLGIGEELVHKLNTSERPVIVIINKVDLVTKKQEDNTSELAIQTIQKWRSLLPNAFAILPTCAANGPNDPGVEALRSILLANDPDVDVGGAIRGLGRPVPGMFAASVASAPMMMITNDVAKQILPIGPPLYHADFFTDRTDRFCASELIRETLFTQLGKELPYCCEVRVETFDESKRYLDEDEDEDGGNNKNGNNGKSMIRIGAVILVERDSQKGIVVGKGGQKIKEVGIDARKKLQDFFGVKVSEFVCVCVPHYFISCII